MSLGKIGCTEEPYGRRYTYLTGCPPGLTPSQDIDYDAIWETTASTRDDLYDLEDEVHNQFLRYRMMREKPGDSEWFNFLGKNPCDEVRKFMETRQWVKREVPLCEIRHRKRTSRYLRKQYYKNLQFIKKQSTRNDILNRIQEPVVLAITAFITDPDNKAGYVVAPCGSGKTLMSSKGIRNVRRCIICCPSKRIQDQWRTTLISEGIFSEDSIHIIGSSGTTNPNTICSIFTEDTYCIISTYMSSHLLVDIITAKVNILILDEAHHMAGIVARTDSGEGRTRRLMLKASELGIKRLSLTYTPRFIADANSSEVKYLTMDDDNMFGKKIAEMKIRDLIHKGVLPDYRLWTLRDEARKGTGIIGKAECLLEAWSATEIVRGEEKYILHHLVVFASTTQEAMTLEAFFKEKTTNTLVLRVGEGDNLDKPIRQFTEAPRAIIVNCFVLNEGVDIPIANAVAITYPKQSRGQITQMVLRAGRWYEGKSIFHILIPTLGDEDLSGFEEVLSALASCDDQIRDEIILRSKVQEHPITDNVSLHQQGEQNDTVPECIMIDEFDANEEDIRRCFRNIRRNLFSARESKRIQELCIKEGITTSIEYSLLRQQIPELPENPRLKNELWFDFLNPSRFDRILARDFVITILEHNNLRVGHKYDEWRGVQPPDVIARLPSVQNITDGFFGSEDTNFNTLREKYGRKVIGRGR